MMHDGQNRAILRAPVFLDLKTPLTINFGSVTNFHLPLGWIGYHSLLTSFTLNNNFSVTTFTTYTISFH